MKLRSSLYKAARIMGDANAVSKNKVPQRIVRKAVYRSVFKWLR